MQHSGTHLFLHHSLGPLPLNLPPFNPFLIEMMEPVMRRSKDVDPVGNKEPASFDSFYSDLWPWHFSTLWRMYSSQHQTLSLYPLATKLGFKFFIQFHYERLKKGIMPPLAPSNNAWPSTMEKLSNCMLFSLSMEDRIIINIAELRYANTLRGYQKL